jgi:hypothetical protein
MALSLEDGNLVWQKVKIALADANPAVHAAFAELKKYLAQQKRNPQLQFKAFSEAEADASGGTVLLDAAHRLYAVAVKKDATATDNYLKVYDDATDDTTAGDQIVALALLEASEWVIQIYPNGVPMGTGAVVTAHTTSIGTTDGSDSGNGFIIVGAA